MFNIGKTLQRMMLWRDSLFSFDKETNWSADENTAQVVKEKPEPAICCAFCQHPITNRKSAIDVAGSHRHLFTNPDGVSFEIALYEKADCISHGIATLEYTWFTGYSWKVALCSNCKAHLGWYYTGAESPDFYGLIVDHIVET